MPITAPVAITRSAWAVVAGPLGIAIAESAAVAPPAIPATVGPNQGVRRSRLPTCCRPADWPGGVDGAIPYLSRAGRADTPHSREGPGRRRHGATAARPVSHADRPAPARPRLREQALAPVLAVV